MRFCRAPVHGIEVIANGSGTVSDGYGGLAFPTFFGHLNHLLSPLNETYSHHTHPTAKQIVPLAAPKVFAHIHLPILSVPRLKAVIDRHSTTHILGSWDQDTQPHEWHEPWCWRRSRTEQVDDNKMDWPDKRWAAKQHKLNMPSLRVYLISPAGRLFRSGIHFLKFSSFLTFWKILPEILGSLQAMGGSWGAARVDKWLRSRLEAETTAAKKQISWEEQGREGMNKKKKRECVS